MTAKQTPILLGRFVEHQDYFNSLLTEDAQWAIQNPKDAAALCVTAIKNRTNGAPKTERTYQILRPVAQPPATNRSFRADDTFFNKKSGVKMGEHSSNFKNWYASKTEENAPEGMLVPLTPTQNVSDKEIIADIGGEEKAEVTLTEIWRLIERQANGEEGILLNNGRANIFYVRDVNLVLRAVDVYRNDNWLVHASALDDYGWHSDYRVFSRNS
ncbi:MAG: hypothetical protein A3B25_02935 [Candidatus Ryanbacteria bacterium RIFCSPLOWO2_01_FULL_48_26]|uniref:Uncharacterized protein n=1 Tax=Candidatus Ryanbacteria bacterium RIFCSPLOWO2_01_FULL_48_26 TaxID=1802126 RepID=A0A1G2GRG0_9BACT|nr:MAG: hypothetical protein A3B25_02935 [Candidatus Ryanbacteria bacterium RIFCSPLOWO2_01_FULL_48_26]